MGGVTERATNPATIEGRIEHTSGYSVYPHDLDDLDDINAPSVATGQKWDYPERFRRWQYRFPTFEDALAAARTVVDDIKINGRTWAQWQERDQSNG